MLTKSLAAASGVVKTTPGAGHIAGWLAAGTVVGAEVALCVVVGAVLGTTVDVASVVVVLAIVVVVARVLVVVEEGLDDDPQAARAAAATAIPMPRRAVRWRIPKA